MHNSKSQITPFAQYNSKQALLLARNSPYEYMLTDLVGSGRGRGQSSIVVYNAKKKLKGKGWKLGIPPSPHSVWKKDYLKIPSHPQVLNGCSLIVWHDRMFKKWKYALMLQIFTQKPPSLMNDITGGWTTMSTKISRCHRRITEIGIYYLVEWKPKHGQ